MNRQEILTKAIEKAVVGGWDKPMETWKAYDGYIFGTDGTGKSRMWLNDIIFNHDFALALWPWDDSIKCPYCGICLTGSLMHPRPCPFGVAEVFAQPMWQYHLQQMVIADDPIAYLGENI